MKTTVRIVAALGIAVILNSLLTIYYQEKTSTGQIMYVLDRAAYSYPEPVSTLFIGDSDMGRGVDAREFGLYAYNLWSPGQCFVRSFYRLDALLEEKNYPIETIIFSVSAHSFTESRSKGLFHLPWSKYIEHLEVGAAFNRPAEFALRRIYTRHMPYAGKLEDYTISYGQPVTVDHVADLQGGLPQRNTQRSGEWPRTMARRRLEQQFAQRPEAISPGYIHYLRRLIDAMQNRGARVLLITPPVTRAYWEESRSYLQHEHFYEAIAGPTGVKYLDYHDLLYDKPEMFLDPDHLNE